jgi:hypothetical protein
VNRPYVVKLGDQWTWGCWTCDARMSGFNWQGAVYQALRHAAQAAVS